jgi:hypothetical protein
MGDRVLLFGIDCISRCFSCVSTVFRPITWAEPGAWKGCSSDPAATWSFSVPCCKGLAKVSVPVPVAVVAGWLANNGSANYGLLFK